eukprot:1819333-Pleurochrysis_carterae.AAC.3
MARRGAPRQEGEPSPSASRRPAACAPTGRNRLIWAPRLARSCAMQFSLASALRARRCARRWPSSASLRSGVAARDRL